MTTIPNIRVRGVRQTCPTGHVVGRLGRSDGAAQFIPLDVLAAAVSAHQLRAAKEHDKLGVTAAGPFTALQQFTMAPAIAATVFPAATGGSTAVCAVAPHGAVTFYLVQNLPLFLSNPSAAGGIVAKIVFGAGATTGTVSFPAGNVTVPLSQQLTLVMPSSADTTFSSINLLFVGDPA